MSKFRVVLIVFAMLCLQRSASSQAVSGASFITGFELGSLAEGSGNTGGSVQSAVVRSGSYAYRANPISSNQYIGFSSRSSGGVMRQMFKSSRFYIYIAALPLNGSVSIVKLGGAATFNPEVDLNSDGTLTLADSWYPSIARSQNALTPDGLWHRVEFDVGSGLRVYVDGTLWASGGSTTYPAAISILFGAGASPTFINATADLYFDDILVDAGSFSQSGLPGDGHAVLLKPSSDPAALNSWTNGAGSSSSLYMGVRNVPAAGKSRSLASNMTQIKNGSHGTNLDYKPTIQTYASAGIPGNATVNAVMALGNDGQEDTKGKGQPGGLWIDQNPSQTVGGYSFDFGDSYGPIGNFPSGWSSHYGPVSAKVAVNIQGSPVVAIRKSSGTNVDVDFLGVYVDYR
jgi:hypothetical protein